MSLVHHIPFNKVMWQRKECGMYSPPSPPQLWGIPHGRAAPFLDLSLSCAVTSYCRAKCTVTHKSSGSIKMSSQLHFLPLPKGPWLSPSPPSGAWLLSGKDMGRGKQGSSNIPARGLERSRQILNSYLPVGLLVE